jgi:hypothetical protein
MGPQVYELRVRGPVPEQLLRDIGAQNLGEEPPLTILRTVATDQSGLHGMLQRLNTFGLELLEVRSAVVPEPPDAEPDTGLAEDETSEDWAR